MNKRYVLLLSLMLLTGCDEIREWREYDCVYARDKGSCVKIAKQTEAIERQTEVMRNCKGNKDE